MLKIAPPLSPRMAMSTLKTGEKIGIEFPEPFGMPLLFAYPAAIRDIFP
jgi:hypothetical protein